MADAERDKQIESLKYLDKAPQSVPDSDTPHDHVANAERGLRVAEEELARNPNSQACKDEVEVRKQNLKKAKRL